MAARTAHRGLKGAPRTPHPSRHKGRRQIPPNLMGTRIFRAAAAHTTPYQRYDPNTTVLTPPPPAQVVPCLATLGVVAAALAFVQWRVRGGGETYTGFRGFTWNPWASSYAPPPRV